MPHQWQSDHMLTTTDTAASAGDTIRRIPCPQRAAAHPAAASAYVGACAGVRFLCVRDTGQHLKAGELGTPPSKQ